MKKILIVLFLISGCSTSTPVIKILPSQELLKECPIRKNFTGLTILDIINYTKKLSIQYDICAASKKALIQQVK